MMGDSSMPPLRRGVPPSKKTVRFLEDCQTLSSRLYTLREKIDSHNSKLKQSIVLEQIKEIQVRIIQYNMMLQCIDKSHNEQNIDNNQYNTDRRYCLNKLLDNYYDYQNYVQHIINDSELKTQLMEKIRNKIELITQEMSVGLRRDKMEVCSTLDYSMVLNDHLVFDDSEIKSESNVDSIQDQKKVTDDRSSIHSQENNSMYQLYLNSSNTSKTEQSMMGNTELKGEETPACCLSTIQHVLGFK